MPNSSTEKRNKVRWTFTIDPQIFAEFRALCGMVPMSRMAEDLIQEFIKRKRAETRSADFFQREGSPRKKRTA